MTQTESQESLFFPLSHGQRALWFLHQSAPGSAAYNLTFSARTRSPVDAEALRRAFQTLVDRYPMLRTVFVERSGETVQQVLPQARVAFELVEASG